MNWMPVEIVVLRKQLGWMRSDLARRLGCTTEDIRAWESGEKTPERSFQQQLSHLRLRVDQYAKEVSQGPAAELLMNEKGLEQVTEEEVESTPKSLEFP